MALKRFIQLIHSSLCMHTSWSMPETDPAGEGNTELRGPQEASNTQQGKHTGPHRRAQLGERGAASREHLRAREPARRACAARTGGTR